MTPAQAVQPPAVSRAALGQRPGSGTENLLHCCFPKAWLVPAGGWQCPRGDLAPLTRVSVRSARGQVRQEGLQGQGTAAAAHPKLGHRGGGVQDQAAHRLLQPDRWDWHRAGAGHSLTLTLV